MSDKRKQLNETVKKVLARIDAGEIEPTFDSIMEALDLEQLYVGIAPFVALTICILRDIED